MYRVSATIPRRDAKAAAEPLRIVLPQGAAPAGTSRNIDSPNAPRVAFAPPHPADADGPPSPRDAPARIEREIALRRTLAGNLRARIAIIDGQIHEGNAGDTGASAKSEMSTYLAQRRLARTAVAPPGGMPLEPAIEGSDEVRRLVRLFDQTVHMKTRIDSLDKEIFDLQMELDGLKGGSPGAGQASGGMQVDKAEKRRLKKEAVAQAKQAPPAGPAERIQKAEAMRSRDREVSTFAAFIVNRLGQRDLQTETGAWRDLPKCKTFSDLPRDVQHLVEDFSQLTADQRNATRIMLEAQALQREQAPAQPQGEPEIQAALNAAQSVPESKSAPEPPGAQRRKHTPLENYLNWEKNIKRETVNQLADFINLHVHKEPGDPDRSMILEWPGYERLGPGTQSLGARFGKLKNPLEAQATRVGRALADLQAKAASRAQIAPGNSQSAADRVAKPLHAIRGESAETPPGRKEMLTIVNAKRVQGLGKTRLILQTMEQHLSADERQQVAAIANLPKPEHCTRVEALISHPGYQQMGEHQKNVAMLTVQDLEEVGRYRKTQAEIEALSAAQAQATETHGQK